MTAPTVNPTHAKLTDELERIIDEALAEAAAGHFASATRRFDLCRTLLSSATDPALLKKHVDNQTSKLRQEAEKMKTLVERHSPPINRGGVYVVADSLGLPRPVEAARFAEAVKDTYSMRIAATPGCSMNVLSHCQRYFTTDDAVVHLKAARENLSGRHVLIHLGLNDSVTRMFMEDQRIALSLFPTTVSEKVLTFAKKYRVSILAAYPHHQYVPLDRFVANIHSISNICALNGAKSLSVSTIILSPRRFWAKTPEMPQRYGRYNLAVMETTKAIGAKILDVDRLLWEAGIREHLDDDGMHLSPLGHKVLAEAFRESVN